jgi:hypothetical protein
MEIVGHVNRKDQIWGAKKIFESTSEDIKKWVAIIGRCRE